jgi:hypothetical protein
MLQLSGIATSQLVSIPFAALSKGTAILAAAIFLRIPLPPVLSELERKPWQDP